MWTVSVVLLCFITFCSDSFGFALVLFHSAWVEHCSGTTELGFSLSALGRGLSSLCDHLRVQYFIVIYLVENFPRVSHLVLVLWGLGALGTPALALCPSPPASPSLLSVLLLSPVLEFALTPHSSHRSHAQQLQFIIPGLCHWELQLRGPGSKGG